MRSPAETTSPVFGSTVTAGAFCDTLTLNVPAASCPSRVRAIALPLSPAATCQRSVCVPATTGVTCHSNVRDCPAGSAPSAHVDT